MKKFSAISYALFYLLLSVGMSVNVHYCGGSLASVNLYSSESGCSCGERGLKSGCCEDFLLEFSLESEQNLAKTLIVPSELQHDFLPSSNVDPIEIEMDEDQVDGLGIDLAPPKERPKWLLNCALTFYG